MEEFEKINVDEEVNRLTPEQDLLAAQRAFKAMGVPCELGDDGKLIVEEFDEEEYLPYFEAELIKLVTQQLYRDLEEDGLVEADGIDANGEIIYKITDAGLDALDEHADNP